MFRIEFHLVFVLAIPRLVQLFRMTSSYSKDYLCFTKLMHINLCLTVLHRDGNTSGKHTTGTIFQAAALVSVQTNQNMLDVFSTD